MDGIDFLECWDSSFDILEIGGGDALSWSILVGQFKVKECLLENLLLHTILSLMVYSMFFLFFGGFCGIFVGVFCWVFFCLFGFWGGVFFVCFNMLKGLLKQQI